MPDSIDRVDSGRPTGRKEAEDHDYGGREDAGQEIDPNAELIGLFTSLEQSILGKQLFIY
jgi:hypothetical protein